MPTNMPLYMSKNIEEPTKVVQTEVPTTLYERFARAADARTLTIKEAASEAIAEFVYRHEPVDPDDPLFEALSGDTGSAPTDDDASERVDEIAYGDRD